MPISAIGISPQSDKVRLVGLDDGQVFGTSTGSSKLIEVTGPIFPNYVTRIAIDPTNWSVAYMALNGYGVPSGQQIWKTTNLVTAFEYARNGGRSTVDGGPNRPALQAPAIISFDPIAGLSY